VSKRNITLTNEHGDELTAKMLDDGQVSIGVYCDGIYDPYASNITLSPAGISKLITFLQGVNKPNRLSEIVGKWPGNETDEKVQEFLDEIS
jgi:hypothetical protein